MIVARDKDGKEVIISELSHLEIISPNGLNVITLDANDQCPGIWLSNVGRPVPAVAIYLDRIQGPVVGVYGKDQKQLAAYIATEGNGGKVGFVGGKYL